MPRDGYYEVSGYLELKRRRGGGTGIVNAQVIASLDDGFSHSTPGIDPAVGQLSVGLSTVTRDVWLRFLNIAIPQGVTIDVAYISVNAEGTGEDGVGVKANIYADDIDDAVAPTSRAEHVALNRTTAFTAWDDIDFTVNIFTDSPSIVDVIQEIADRGSWTPGNALQILIDDDGSDAGKVYDWWAYDGNTTRAPKLHVEWSS